MTKLVPEVHLFICMDSRVPPGAILHALDLLRAQDWQKEIVLLCDKSWEPYVTIEQPALFLDRKLFFHKSEASSDSIVNIQALENFLEQLDSFDIQHVLQLGELNWGRWIKAYLTDVNPKNQHSIAFEDQSVSAVQIVNHIARELGLDLSVTEKEEVRSSHIFIDPYVSGELSEEFLALIEEGSQNFPQWVSIICHEKDKDFFAQLGFIDQIIEPEETDALLFNQYVLCFDELSPIAQASRSYNVALFTSKKTEASSAFVPGDIVINPAEPIHVTELFNLLSYWKRNRLKELAFQWMNMNIDIDVIENFHSRIVKRKLQSYASDLNFSQIIVDKFSHSNAALNDRDVADFVIYIRRKIDNDPYALSFSLKLLIMITERMLASASCGERLFQRLGSDNQRIIIGEALVEGIFTKNQGPFEKIDLVKELKKFQNFLYQLDYQNDNSVQVKERES